MNDRIQMALDAMQAKAQEMGVQGVASVVLQPLGDRDNFTTHHRTVGRYFRPPQPEERGPEDKGTNYLIGSFAKIAESIRTAWGSGQGQSPLLRCEFGWRGSLVAWDGDQEIYTGFSGGTPEQDVQIAQAGQRHLVE